MKILTEARKSKDPQRLYEQMVEALDKTSEIVIKPKSSKASWVLNLKCPFMEGYVDQEVKQSARGAMIQYAICELTDTI